MNIRLRCILASLALAAASFARAESAPTPHAPARPLGAILTVLDTDHDGALSLKEIASAPVALTALDLNEDGVISPDERRTTSAEGRPLRVARGGVTFNLLLALDANHDGNLQSIEIANAVASLKRLDLNGDGILEPGELRGMTLARN